VVTLKFLVSDLDPGGENINRRENFKLSKKTTSECFVRSNPGFSLLDLGKSYKMGRFTDLTCRPTNSEVTSDEETVTTDTMWSPLSLRNVFLRSEI